MEIAHETYTSVRIGNLMSLSNPQVARCYALLGLSALFGGMIILSWPFEFVIGFLGVLGGLGGSI